MRASCCARIPPGWMVVLFCWINLLNYMDRGIVSGGFSFINAFILQTLPGADGANVDGYRGLLTSSFIVCYAASSIVFGHLVHRFPPFKLMAVGLLVWCVAVLICAFAPNYWVLLAGRALSGVGEASFQCVVPPFIDDNAGKAQRAKWLAFFFAMIPFGTAIGFGWSDIVASSLGWGWAFGLEAPLMLPAVAVVFFLPYHKKPSKEAAKDDEAAPIRPRSDTHPEAGLSVWQELARVLGSPIYLAAAFGYAAYTGAVAGFAAFGPQMLFDLDLVQSRGSASVLFGGVIAVTGFLGTAFGGYALDMMQAGDDAKQRDRIGLTSSGALVVSAAGAEARTGVEGGAMGAFEIDGGPQPSHATGGFADHVGSDDGASAGPHAGKGEPSAGGREDAPDEESEEDATRLRTLDVKLCASLRQATLLTFGGMLASLVAPFVVPYGVGPFLGVLTVGTLLLFATTAAVNIAVMASVPAESRPFAIGLATAITHAFGDVPSPVLIGLLSDDLAPNVPGHPRSRWGLQLTLIVVICWIGWAVLLWGAAWAWSRSRRSFNERHRVYEELGGAGDMVWRLCGPSKVDGGDGDSLLVPLATG